MSMKPRCEGMSSRVRELEVNNHALTARLKELQEQLDAQALQNRFPARFLQLNSILLFSL